MVKKLSMLALGLGGSVLVFGAVVAHAESFTTSEVAKHATKSDCWMIIDNKVYDFTNYLPQHPAPADVMLKFCGKDGSEGWKTKGGVGRPHSPRAAAMIEQYRKGDWRS